MTRYSFALEDSSWSRRLEVTESKRYNLLPPSDQYHFVIAWDKLIWRDENLTSQGNFFQKDVNWWSWGSKVVSDETRENHYMMKYYDDNVVNKIRIVSPMAAKNKISFNPIAFIIPFPLASLASWRFLQRRHKHITKMFQLNLASMTPENWLNKAHMKWNCQFIVGNLSPENARVL